MEDPKDPHDPHPQPETAALDGSRRLAQALDELLQVIAESQTRSPGRVPVLSRGMQEHEAGEELVTQAVAATRALKLKNARAKRRRRDAAKSLRRGLTKGQ